jgi:hypothetical protein
VSIDRKRANEEAAGELEAVTQEIKWHKGKQDGVDWQIEAQLENEPGH